MLQEGVNTTNLTAVIGGVSNGGDNIRDEGGE